MIVKSDVRYRCPEWATSTPRTYIQMISGGGKCGPRACLDDLYASPLGFRSCDSNVLLVFIVIIGRTLHVLPQRRLGAGASQPIVKHGSSIRRGSRGAVRAETSIRCH